MLHNTDYIFSFSIPNWDLLEVFKDAAALDATLSCGPLRIFGKLATSLLIEFSTEECRLPARPPPKC